MPKHTTRPNTIFCGFLAALSKVVLINAFPIWEWVNARFLIGCMCFIVRVSNGGTFYLGLSQPRGEGEGGGHSLLDVMSGERKSLLTINILFLATKYSTIRQ